MASLMKRVKYWLLRSVFCPLLPSLFRLYTWTLRIDAVNYDAIEKGLARGETLILCCLHQHLLVALCQFLKGYGHLNIPVIISPSADGDIVADLFRRMGGNPVRGSSSRDGSKALLMMIDCVKQTHVGVHILDGPRGPRGVVKGGLIHLAHATEANIMPMYVKAENAWHFKSWDRFLVPKPFSRVKTWMSGSVKLEKTSDRERFESQRLAVQRMIHEELDKNGLHIDLVPGQSSEPGESAELMSA